MILFASAVALDSLGHISAATLLWVGEAGPSQKASGETRPLTISQFEGRKVRDPDSLAGPFLPVSEESFVGTRESLCL